MKEEREPVGLNLPKKLIQEIDVRRGRKSRSAEISDMLESYLKEHP